MRLAVFLALGAIGAQAPVQEPSPLARLMAARLDRCVVEGERVFMAGDPVLVAVPRVRQAKWSPNGAFLLVESVPAARTVNEIRAKVLRGQQENSEEAKARLSLYEVATGRIDELLNPQAEAAQLVAAEWLGRGDEALLLIAREAPEGQPRSSLHWLRARSREMVTLAPFGERVPRFMSLTAAPDASYAIVVALFREPGGDRRAAGPPPVRSEMVIMRPGGGTVAVPAPAGGGRLQVLWSSGTPYVQHIRRVGSAASLDWYILDPVRGALSKASEPKDASRRSETAARNSLTAEAAAAQVKFGEATFGTSAAWLQNSGGDARNRALLSAEGELAVLSPDLRAVAYVSHGALYLRPVFETSRSAYDQAVALNEREKALIRARQVGLSMLMYAGDHEDRFPTGRIDLFELIGRYLHDRDLLSGFLYTFPGGDAKAVANPAQTELGYIELPGGRAVVYVDGHVAWVPNPPPGARP